MSNILKINAKSINIKTATNCQYCNGKNGSCQWICSGFECEKIEPQQYEYLISKGWRRSGLYFYKPHPELSCCKAISLRMDVTQFQNDKKPVNKVNAKISQIKPHGVKIITYDKVVDIPDTEKNAPIKEELNQIAKKHIKHPNYAMKSLYKQLPIYSRNYPLKYFRIKYQKEQIQAKITESLQEIYSLVLKNKSEFQIVLNRMFKDSNGKSYLDKFNKDFDLIVQQSAQNKLYELISVPDKYQYGHNFIALIITCIRNNIRETIGMEYGKKIFKIKDLLRNDDLTKFINNIISQSIKIQQFQVNCLFQAGQLYFSTEDALKYVTERKKIQDRFNELRHQLFKDSNVNIESKAKVQMSYEIQILWAKPKYDDKSYQLYQQYMKEIHGNQFVTQNYYIQFLCQSPLPFNNGENDDPMTRTGTWHVKYTLEDQLIAVGVVDILSTGLSSVYFFYEPRYKQYSLGNYGNLQEIEYVQKRQRVDSYYIHKYSKTDYKVKNYKPQQYLNPFTYEYVDVPYYLDQIMYSFNNSNQQQKQTDEEESLMSHLGLDEQSLQIVFDQI